MTLVPRILDGLRENGVEDVLVVVGGTIPSDDAEELKGGRRAVFTPGAPTSEIVDFLRAKISASGDPTRRRLDDHARRGERALRAESAANVTFAGDVQTVTASPFVSSSSDG